MPDIKNRIIGHGEESLDNILFNPRNWRIHPLNQQNALKGILDEVGWVQDVIVNKRTGNLVDGHLRCQLAEREGAKTIPVVYVDLSEEEEALILSTLDPVAAMAATDKAKLDDLMASIRTDNEQVQKLMQEIAEKEQTIDYQDGEKAGASPWERMGKDGADGVIFSFGSVVCRLPSKTYDDFYSSCPDTNIEEWLIELLGI